MPPPRFYSGAGLNNFNSGTRNPALQNNPLGSAVAGNTGFVPNATPDPLQGGNTAAGADPLSGMGGAFGGGAGQFLQSLYSARPQFLRQQGQLLNTLGPALRQSVFNASPELAQASQYLTQKFSDPMGGMASTFQDYIRGAQAAHGFTGGGSGVVGEEARYLNNYAEQQRQALLPQLQGFGNNMLQISGLSAPPDINLSAIGSLAFQNNQLQAQTLAGQQQSALAQQMFKQAYGGSTGGAAPSPFGNRTSGGGAGGAAGGGGSYMFSAGSHGGGTFDPSGNLISSGNGNTFGGGVNANGTPRDADLATQAKILQASGKINTQQQYLDFIGQGNQNARATTTSFNGVSL